MADTFVDCPLCDNNKAENISTHTYPCKCGDSVEVNEYVCFICGASFEMVDDQIIGEPLNNMDDVMMIPFDEMPNLEELTKFLGNLGIPTVDFSDDITSMSALTHECLVCKAPSFDNGKGVICCGSCGHEWEVIKS